MREIFLDERESKVKYNLLAPLTSENVHILIYNIDEGNQYYSDMFKVDNISANKIGIKPSFLKPEINRFIKFILPICYNYNALDMGWYYSDNKEFSILNRHKITEAETPSRISSDDNHIEISYEDFKDLSLPRKFMILCHEFAHNYMNKNINDESEADINGLKIFLACNFPVTEGVYAFTKILPNSEEGILRVKNIIDLLEYNNFELNIFKNKDDKKDRYISLFTDSGIGV